MVKKMRQAITVCANQKAKFCSSLHQVYKVTLWKALLEVYTRYTARNMESPV